MIGVSAFFISRKIKVRFILIPAILVLITTLAALVYLTFRTGGYWTSGNFALAGISIIMFVLGAFVAWEGFRILMKKE